MSWWLELRLVPREAVKEASRQSESTKEKREVTRHSSVSARVMRGAEMVSSSAYKERGLLLGRNGEDGKAALS